MNVLLFSNGNPFFDAGGYNLQCTYLIQMFKKFKSEGLISNYYGAFTSIPNPGFEKNPLPTTSSQLIRKNGFSPRDPSIFEDMMFLLNFSGDRPSIAKINGVLRKYKIDIFICLCDLMKFMVPLPRPNPHKTIEFDKFYCTSLCWWPCHYHPIDYYSKEVLQYFDAIIPLCPSMIPIIQDSIPGSFLNIEYIPHVIEYSEIQYRPEEIEVIQKKLGFPKKGEKWVCLINAMNYEISCRKSFDTTLMAFKKFYDKHPDKAFLYIHSSSSSGNEPIQISYEIPKDFKIGETLYVQIPKSNKKIPVQTQEKTHSAGGKYQIEYKKNQGSKEAFSLKSLCQLLKIPSHAFKINTQIISHRDLTFLYQMSQVLLAPSRSEGFGIPILEAQSVGTPVITTKFLAMDDFTVNGISVEPVQDCLNHYQMGIWKMPSVEGISDAIEDIFSWSPSYRSKMSKMGKYYIQGEMSYQKVSEKFSDFFRKLPRQLRYQTPWLQFIHGNKLAQILDDNSIYPSQESKDSQEKYGKSFKQMITTLFATKQIQTIYLYHTSQIDLICHILLLSIGVKRVFIHEAVASDMTVLMRFPKLRFFPDVAFKIVSINLPMLESNSVSGSLYICQKLADIPLDTQTYLSNQENVSILSEPQLSLPNIQNIQSYPINNDFTLSTFQKKPETKIDHHFVIYQKKTNKENPSNNGSVTWIENLDGNQLESRENWIQELTLSKTIDNSFSTKSIHTSSLIMEILIHRSIWKIIAEHPEWTYIAVYFEGAERLFSFRSKVPDDMENGFCWLGDKHLGHGYLLHRSVVSTFIQESQPIKKDLLPFIHDNLVKHSVPQISLPFLDSVENGTEVNSIQDSAVFYWYIPARDVSEIQTQQDNLASWKSYCSRSKVDLHIRVIHDREPMERFQHLVQIICDLLLKYSRVITVSSHNIIIHTDSNCPDTNSQDNPKRIDGLDITQQEFQSYKTIFCHEDYPIIFKKSSLLDIQTNRGSLQIDDSKQLSQALTLLVKSFPPDHVLNLRNTHIWSGYLGCLDSEQKEPSFVHPNDSIVTISSQESSYHKRLFTSYSKWHNYSKFNDKTIDLAGKKLSLEPMLAKDKKTGESYSWTPLENNSIYCWLSVSGAQEICLQPQEPNYDTMEKYQVLQSESNIAIVTIINKNIDISNIYLALKSKSEYCLQNNYDHVVSTKIPDKEDLLKYKYVMYSDPYVMIMNKDVKLHTIAEHLLPENNEECIAVSNICDGTFGNVLLRITEWLLDYLHLGMIGIQNPKLFIKKYKSDSKDNENSLRRKVKVIQSLRTLDSVYYSKTNPRDTMYHLGDFCINFKGLEFGIRQWMFWMEFVSYEFSKSQYESIPPKSKLQYHYGTSSIEFTEDQYRRGTITIGQQKPEIEWYSDVDGNRFFILPNDSDELFIPKPRNLFTRCESSSVETPSVSFSIEKPDHHGTTSQEDNSMGDGNEPREVCL